MAERNISQKTNELCAQYGFDYTHQLSLNLRTLMDTILRETDGDLIPSAIRTSGHGGTGRELKGILVVTTKHVAWLPVGTKDGDRPDITVASRRRLSGLSVRTWETVAPEGGFAESYQYATITWTFDDGAVRDVEYVSATGDRDQTVMRVPRDLWLKDAMQALPLPT